MSAKSSLIVNRYARALMNLCEGDMTRAETYLQVLRSIEVLFQQTFIRKVLVSPVTPKDLKWQALHHSLEQIGADATLQNFIRNMVNSGRTMLLPALPDVVQTTIAKKKGIVEALVVSSEPLTPESLASLNDSIKQMTGSHEVHIKTDVDPDLLGGLVVSIGNKKLDLSLKTKLDSIVNEALA